MSYTMYYDMYLHMYTRTYMYMVKYNMFIGHFIICCQWIEAAIVRTYVLIFHTCTCTLFHEMIMYVRMYNYVLSDIDECEIETDECDDFHAVCTNTFGSYDCTCIVGFSGNGRTCGEWRELSERRGRKELSDGGREGETEGEREGERGRGRGRGSERGEEGWREGEREGEKENCCNGVTFSTS